MSTIETPGRPQGSLDLSVAIEDCFGVKDKRMKPLHFVLEPVATGKSRKLKTEPDGHPADGPITVNVGSYNLRLGRWWNYPFDGQLHVEGMERASTPAGVDVEIERNRCSRLALTVTESPRRRLRRMALWIAIIVPFSLFPLLDTRPLATSEFRENGEAVIMAGMFLALTAATAWAIADSRRKFSRRVQNEISRHPSTIAADLLLVVILLLLATVASTLALLGFSELEWVAVVDSTIVPPATVEAATLGDLHESAFWHLADAVPVIDVPAAWGWDNPIRITGRLAWLAGLPFLLTRALVALGIVGLIIEGWRAYSHRSSTAGMAS